MIEYYRTRIYLAEEGDGLIEGYTWKRNLKDIIGINSENIHIHVSQQWMKNHADEDFTALIVNLSCNVNPPLITFGVFSWRWSKMMDILTILKPHDC